jgi:hypothetical protein
MPSSNHPNPHSLYRAVIFHLAKECGKDMCLRCGKKIPTIRELSIDHAVAWNGNLERYWDMENIGFSHLSCNSRHGTTVRVYTKLNDNAPDGSVWCGGCRKYKGVDDHQFPPRLRGAWFVKIV